MSSQLVEELPSLQLDEWMDFPDWRFATTSVSPFSCVGGPHRKLSRTFDTADGAEAFAARSVSLYPLLESGSGREGGPIADRYYLSCFEDKYLVALAAGIGCNSRSIEASQKAVVGFSEFMKEAMGRLSNLRQTAFCLKKSMKEAHAKIVEKPAQIKEAWNPGVTQLLGGLLVKLHPDEEFKWAFIGCSIGETKVFRICRKGNRKVTDLTRGNRPLCKNYHSKLPSAKIGSMNEDSIPDLRQCRMFLAALDDDDLLLFTTAGITSSFCPQETGLSTTELNLDVPSWEKLDERTGIRVLDEFLTNKIREKINPILETPISLLQSDFPGPPPKANNSHIFYTASEIVAAVTRHSKEKAAIEHSEEVTQRRLKEGSKSWISTATCLALRALSPFPVAQTFNGISMGGDGKFVGSGSGGLGSPSSTSISFPTLQTYLSSLPPHGWLKKQSSWQWQSRSAFSPNGDTNVKDSDPISFDLWHSLGQIHPMITSRLKMLKQQEFSQLFLVLEDSDLELQQMFVEEPIPAAQSIPSLTVSVTPGTGVQANISRFQGGTTAAVISNNLSPLPPPPSSCKRKRSISLNNEDFKFGVSFRRQRHPDSGVEKWINLGHIQIDTKRKKSQLSLQLAKILRSEIPDRTIVEEMVSKFEAVIPDRQLFELQTVQQCFRLRDLSSAFEFLTGDLVVKQGVTDVYASQDEKIGTFCFVRVEGSKFDYLSEFVRQSILPYLPPAWEIGSTVSFLQPFCCGPTFASSKDFVSK